MSTTYKTTTGDTFESIARKRYGTETQAQRIARANPGLTEPLPAGLDINTPALPSAPKNAQQRGAANTEQEVALLIDGQRFRYWSDITVTRSIDAVDVVEFSAPFDVDAPGFKETFRPYSFREVEVTVGGEPLFTGTLIDVNPVIEPNSKTIAVSCYSLPGVLGDCTAPASAFPLEYNNQGLKEIAAAQADPFGIDVQFDGDQGAVFERVASTPEKTVLSFLIELAQQRNFIISSTPRGALLFAQSQPAGSPVAILRQGESPLVGVTPAFTPQQYYSHITGLHPIAVGTEGSQFTVKNPRLLGVTRPLTFTAKDAKVGDVKQAVEAKAGRMFGNMVVYTVEVATWRDPSGGLWAPNTTIKLIAPDAMIYTEYSFIVRNVQFAKNGSEETATLTLVMPGSFSGKIPETLPWDD